MDKDLKKLIEETLDDTFKDSPDKMVDRNVDEVYRDVCPHCRKKINEHEEYTEDGGVTWRHSDCKSLISRPETHLEQINRELRPYVSEARSQRQSAHKELGMEFITHGFAPNDKTEKSELPPSGHVKYDKQQPGGTMSAVNTSGLEETTKTIMKELNGRTEREVNKIVAVRGYAKFNDMPLNVVNTTKNPINVTVTEITSTVDDTNAKAYIIRVDDVLSTAK